MGIDLRLYSEKTHMKGFSFLLLALCCLLAGSIIYLLYLPSSLFIKLSISGSALLDLQQKIQLLKYLFPDSAFTRYHLPDILWYQSLLFILYYIYHIKKLFNISLIYYFSLFLPFILEFLQLPGVIPGTFDWLDLLFYFLLFFLNYYCYIRRNKLYEKQDSCLNP